MKQFNQFTPQFEKIYALMCAKQHQHQHQHQHQQQHQPKLQTQLLPKHKQIQTQIQTQTQTPRLILRKHMAKRCTQCKGTNLFVDPTTANKVCGDCGVLSSKIFNTDAEWRYYGCTDDNKHADPTRCGLPIDELLPKSSLTTKIKYVGTKYMSLVRLHKWNIIHPEERSLFTVFKYIDTIFKNVNLSITNAALIQAKEYYKILSAKDNKKGTLTRGIIRKSFIAACIYVSCKNNQTPIQKSEIAKICGISKFAITKGFKKFSVLEKNKNIQLNKPNDTNQCIHNYLHKFANELNFTETMKDIAHIVCERLPRLKLLQDTNDISISAGLLYYVSVLFQNGQEYTQTQTQTHTHTHTHTKNHKQPQTCKRRGGLRRGVNDVCRTKILQIICTSIVTLQKVYKILHHHNDYILIGLTSFIPPKGTLAT